MCDGLRVMPLLGRGWTKEGGRWSLPGDDQPVKTFSKSTGGREQIKERWERKLRNKCQVRHELSPVFLTA